MQQEREVGRVKTEKEAASSNRRRKGEGEGGMKK
jgi:hypothetical protein